MTTPDFNFTEAAIKALLTAKDFVGGMNPEGAFVAGAVSWFLIEASIRKIAAISRTTILIGFLAASGLSAAYLFNNLELNQHEPTIDVPNAHEDLEKSLREIDRLLNSIEALPSAIENQRQP